MLLVPTKEYALYFLILTICIILISFQKEISLNIVTKILLIFIIYLAITSGLRFIFTFESNLRDFMEIYRFIPFLLIFMFIKNWSKMNFNNIIDGLFIYTLLDGIVSIIQLERINTFGIMDFVSKYYNAQNHFEISLLISNRALGFSSGPGQHAALMLVVFIVFLCNLVFEEERKFISAMGALSNIYIIFTTQSRSVFLVLGIFIILLFLIVIIFEKFKGKLKILSFSILGVLASPYIIEFIMGQRYLSSLFLGITNNSSYMGREEKWSNFIELMKERPSWFLIGHGKDFFGQSSGAMDNEYLYITAIYGVSILILFILGLSIYLLKTLFKWNFVSFYEKVLFFILIGGAILAWPSAFFIDPQIMLIISLISVKIIIGKKNNSKLLRSN